ncbi:hypothetical protein ACIQ6R_13055 [Streptomyces sp. NPDC096048]|uniref:hypothetical protein n=1 Tax=Streptomyces sp. NPDC096048 TaxID=3366072 RepID=UPI00382456EF
MSADFFRPGRTYAYDSTGFTAPELITLFRVVADTAHPDTGKRMAFGWLRVGENQAWSPYAEPADEWPACWTDVTANYGGQEDAPPPTLAADTARRAHLLADMTKVGGRWKSGTVAHWYANNGYTGLGLRAARHDLAVLRDSGAVVQHDEKGVRYFTAARPGVRRG